MNPSEISKRTLPLVAAAVLAAGLSMPAHATVDCSAPKGIEEVKGCAAAKQGPEALRRYVERTRMIHSLYYWDYAPFATGASVAKEDSTPVTVALK